MCEGGGISGNNWILFWIICFMALVIKFFLNCKLNENNETMKALNLILSSIFPLLFIVLLQTL